MPNGPCANSDHVRLMRPLISPITRGVNNILFFPCITYIHAAPRKNYIFIPVGYRVPTAFHLPVIFFFPRFYHISVHRRIYIITHTYIYIYTRHVRRVYICLISCRGIYSIYHVYLLYAYTAVGSESIGGR